MVPGNRLLPKRRAASQLGLVPRGLLQARTPSRGLCPPDIVNVECRPVSAIHVHNLPSPPFCEPTRTCCSDIPWSFSCPGDFGKTCSELVLSCCFSAQGGICWVLVVFTGPSLAHRTVSSLLEQTDV